MNQYEVMYVIDPALEESARTELINRFSELVKKNGGEVDRVDEWGKRRLAYAINYKTEGYYVLMYVTAPSEFPREMERNLKISDSVLRYLVIRFEGELPPKREPLKPYRSFDRDDRGYDDDRDEVKVDDTPVSAPEAEEPAAEAEEPAAEPAEAPAEETPVEEAPAEPVDEEAPVSEME